MPSSTSILTSAAVSPGRSGTDGGRVVSAHRVERRPPRALRVSAQLLEHPTESEAQLGDLSERIPACQRSSRQLRSSDEQVAQLSSHHVASSAAGDQFRAVRDTSPRSHDADPQDRSRDQRGLL
jgi:hypothetical protein